MKEVGNLLMNKRMSTGVSIEEAGTDLNIKDIILENIENGNIGCFKDIALLKEYLVIYAKYLGLNELEILDKFNEYMFEYTSKIPMKEIEKQVLEKNKEKEEDRVYSPYTKPSKKTAYKNYLMLYIICITLTIFLIIWSILEVIFSR